MALTTRLVTIHSNGEWGTSDNAMHTPCRQLFNDFIRNEWKPFHDGDNFFILHKSDSEGDNIHKTNVQNIVTAWKIKYMQIPIDVTLANQIHKYT